jgi:2',3'-cyclic-nucleotide 2'-phosphodiesterase (5'-nucleotidase family)
MSKNWYFFFLALFLCGCSKSVQVKNAETSRIAVDGSVDSIADSAYIAYLAPYKESVEREMAVVIGYAADDMYVGAPECPMLNWATETLWACAKEVCPKKVDMAVMNMGGMRCQWQKGPITQGNVFELMPFDNKLVVLSMKGEDILALCQLFATYGGQGVAGLRMTAVDGQLADVSVGGKPVDKDAIYTVATSDYLASGADHMDALKNHVDYWNSELLVRDLYIAAVKRDTIHAIMDGRMSIL